MNANDKIIERVRKILAKVGRGATQEESDTAVAMAQKILDEHNLSMADLAVHQIEWVDDQVERGFRTSTEATFLNMIFTKFFHVKIVRSRFPDRITDRVTISVFGDAVAVETARFLFPALAQQYRDLFRDFRARTAHGMKQRQAYYMGLTNGLERRLTAISKATRDLAPTTPGTPGADIVLAAAAERLEAAFQAAFPGIERDDSTTTISGPQSTFAAGEQDAARLNLGRPLAAPEQSAATLALPSS